MAMIKGKNTKPEIIVRKILHQKGYRYRLHDSKLPGTPDIILKKSKAAIFINGCFWHGHDNCKYFVLPKTRTDWWSEKIENTKVRDKKNIEELAQQGWKIRIIWECELKPGMVDNTLKNLLVFLEK